MELNRRVLAAAGIMACIADGAGNFVPDSAWRKGERVRGLRACGPVKSGVSRVGRNSSCPCGSGRKFKLCCHQ